MRVPSAVPGGRAGGRAPLAPHWILIGLAPACMHLVSRGRAPVWCCKRSSFLPPNRTCKCSSTVCSRRSLPPNWLPARFTPSMLAPLMHQGWGPAVLPWVAFYGLVYGTAWVLGPLLLPHCRMVKVQSGQRPSSAPAPPQGTPGGSGQLGTPRKSWPTERPAAASRASDFTAFDHPGTAASSTRLAVPTGRRPS